MRRLFAVLIVLLATLPMAACYGAGQQCATVEQLSTELSEAAPTKDGGQMEPDTVQTTTDLYPVRVILVDGVNEPSLVLPTYRLNLGWPGRERQATVYLPAGDFVVRCHIGDKEATTTFTVEADG